MSRRLFVISAIVGIVIGAYLLGRQEVPVPEPTPVAVATPEPTPTPTPTPRPTPEPTPPGTSWVEYLAHVSGAMTDIQGSIEAMVGAGNILDTGQMASNAGRVADRANAELLWLNSIDVQPCYQSAVTAYTTMLTSLTAAYRNAEISITALDVDGINEASALIAQSNGLIENATASLLGVSC